MEQQSQLFRVTTVSLTLGQQTWRRGSIISRERLGHLLDYLVNLGMIEDAVYTQAEDPSLLKMAS